MTNLFKQDPDEFFLDESQNDFSFWFPKVKDCGIAVPKSFYTKITPEEYQPKYIEQLQRAFYLDSWDEDMRVIREWVRSRIVPALEKENLVGHVFVKNGRFSNKFDAAGNCNLYGLYELDRAIANINYNALCVDADGCDEIVVREFIESNRNQTPCIYNGLPLRPEFRVFYDFDTGEAIFTANYWDFDYVYPHLYEATDKIIFEHQREYIETVFRGEKDYVQKMVEDAMKNVSGLCGQWSIDILMDESSKFWLIDMAVAQRSAYWDKRQDYIGKGD